jgi:hypothetical protein
MSPSIEAIQAVEARVNRDTTFQTAVIAVVTGMRRGEGGIATRMAATCNCSPHELQEAAQVFMFLTTRPTEE